MTCGDAVEGRSDKVIDVLVLVGNRAFTVDLVHGGIGVEHPLNQPLQFIVTHELVAPQVTEDRERVTHILALAGPGSTRGQKGA